jgi:hypothetical protein
MPKPASPAQGYTKLEQIDDDDELKDPARAKPVSAASQSFVWRKKADFFWPLRSRLPSRYRAATWVGCGG